MLSSCKYNYFLRIIQKNLLFISFICTFAATNIIIVLFKLPLLLWNNNFKFAAGTITRH